MPSALAQDGSDIQQSSRAEWHYLVKGQTEFEVSDPALLPPTLALAVEKSGCHYKDGIKERPVRFISIEKRRLALVFCWGIAAWDQLFDLTDWRRPKLIEFPFLARKEGFGTTPRSGVITWKKDIGILEAVSRSDSCPSSMFRHSYRPGVTEGWVSAEATFVVVRVEISEACKEEKWVTIWEAVAWPNSAVVR